MNELVARRRSLLHGGGNNVTYLYNEGDERTDIGGSWNSTNASGTNHFYKRSTHLEVDGQKATSYANNTIVVTKANAIDVSMYHKICVEVTIDNWVYMGGNKPYYHWGAFGLGTSNTHDQNWYSNWIAAPLNYQDYEAHEGERLIYTSDFSHNGNAYVFFDYHCGTKENNKIQNFKIHRVWLE